MEILRRIAILLTVTACGCGEKGERLEAVALNKVPPNIMDAATKALPGMKFDMARKAKLHGQDTYEIRGKDKRGKIREVEVSTSGEVLEIE